MEALAQLINNFGDVMDAVTTTAPKVVAGCSVIAAFLPKPDGEGVLSKIHKSINAVAFNFNQAKNES